MTDRHLSVGMVNPTFDGRVLFTAQINAALPSGPKGGIKMTECQKILEYMRKNGSITKLDAIKHYISFTLTQRVADLKRHGYTIETKMEKPANYTGSAYARYILHEQQLEG